MDKLEAVGILSLLLGTLVKEEKKDDAMKEKVIDALTTACVALTESALRDLVNEYVE